MAALIKDLQRHTPAGLNDLGPAAFTRRRAVERRIETVFESYGYAFIAGPALEYLAVFEGKGSVPAQGMYTLPDRAGDMLALRSDMTPPAARIAATNPALDAEHGPLRLCYIEKVFRNHEHFQGKTGEFTQAGVELMGVCSAQADAEVAAVAVKSLLAAGLTDFRVDIGQVDYLRGVLLDSGLDEQKREELTQYMIARDYVAVEQAVASAGETVSTGAKTVLSNLTRWMGGLDMLAEAEGYATNPLSRSAVAHLRDVYGILCDQGLEPYVLFDLSMTGYLDYYTGVIFRGYASGTGYAVVDGGRYDNLLAQFGNPAPAVGFALRLDGVLDALTNPSVPFEPETPDTLLFYTDAGRATALKTADILRVQGVRIENDLSGGNITAVLAYAKCKKMGGVLYFMDADTVILYDLAAGTETTVSVEALLQGNGAYV